jgi:hypothetical protein
MNTHNYKIVEERNVIDDHLLDIIGNEFKFDHPKGIAEWIKNSVAAYQRNNTSDEEQYIYMRFVDSDKDRALIECLDFVGMTAEHIENAFKRWGDPKASMYGSGKKVPGGHGNGGKFYMRQMFRESYFITYKEGLLNIYGFSLNKKYGFADNFKDLKVEPKEALEIANINADNLPKIVLKNIFAKKTGFTIVRGLAPLGMVNKIQVASVCEKLRNHPQVRKNFERIQAMVVHNGKLIIKRLLPDTLKPKSGFEGPFDFAIPKELSYVERGEKYIVEMANSHFEQGKLILKTSEEAMERAGRLGDLNRIDIIGELGVIASYYMYELGVNMYAPAAFIYGDCECPILEDPDDDCVKNDRSKLIAESPKTKALLQWVGERVNEVADQMLDKEREEQKKLERDRSRTYNDLLNKWSSRFLNKMRAEILVGPGEGTGSGFGSGGTSGGSVGGGGGGTGGEKPGKGTDTGGGNTPKKHSRLPMVLLSGIDEDPFNPGVLRTLDPRQGIVYQSLQDAREGIYWINTSSPLAKAIMDRFSEQSQQWRSYLFQRHVDILIKEQLRKLYDKDSDRFNPDSIDAEIFSSFLLKLQVDASENLESFLLEESYEDKRTYNKD